MELQIIQSKIVEIRGYRVILDMHLAQMYQVETKRLKEAVKRNLKRFPSDFMFELSKEEFDSLRTQIASLKNAGRGQLPKYMLFAFTEQGVAMLSSVLNSETAIEINISIMRAFVLMRQMALGYDELLRRIEELEHSTDMQFNEIYQALIELASKKQIETKPNNPIGFKK